MLSYFSKKVNKVYKASKKALTGQQQQYKLTQEYKLIRSLQKFESEILPANKLRQLANLTYNLDQFQLIFQIMMIRVDIKSIEKDNSKKLKQLRNSIIICSYLIRHGASGFIDQFRDNIQVFEALCIEANYVQYDSFEKLSKKRRSYIEQIMNRTKYIIQLLNDKNKLIKQKQISMLIRQKMKLNDKQKENIGYNNQENVKKNQKVDSFLQNYLWKYVSIIDGKIDKVAQIIAQKVQKYILEQQPESFSIQQFQAKQQNKVKTQTDITEKNIKKQIQFLQKRQNIKKEVVNQDLL